MVVFSCCLVSLIIINTNPMQLYLYSSRIEIHSRLSTACKMLVKNSSTVENPAFLFYFVWFVCVCVRRVIGDKWLDVFLPSFPRSASQSTTQLLLKWICRYAYTICVTLINFLSPLARVTNQIKQMKLEYSKHALCFHEKNENQLIWESDSFYFRTASHRWANNENFVL